MPRAKKEKVTNTEDKKENKIKNEKVINGLADALMMGNENLMGWGPTTIGSPEISEIDTLQKNNRWYFISNMRQLLSESYVEHGLIQTVVNVPVDDALRGGVEITTKQLSEEQIQELQISMDRDGDLTIVGQALKYNRLFGGAGIVIITEQDPETPLDLDAIGPDSKLEFRAVDMWELFWTAQNTQQYDPELQLTEGDYYNYYSKKLHKSRVLILKGLTAPSFLRPRLRGWGFSVLECFIRSINQYLKANDLTFEVLDEFKLDIYKIQGLTNTLLSPNGDAAVRRRIDIANHQKNYQNAISMDSEDDYLQKQLSFAGLAEVQQSIRMQIASDLRMPLTKIFGISSAGFNSGEDDIENYNAMVEGEIRQKAKYDILRVLEIKCQKMFGVIPDDLAITFKPLRILSLEQEENAKTQKFNRLLQAKQAGLITLEEFRNSCNRDNILGIKLEDTAIDEITEVEKESKKTEIESGDNIHNENSIAYLIATYAADEGEQKITHPNIQQHQDESLWKKAEETTQKAFGEYNYKFCQWLYERWGGKYGQIPEKKLHNDETIENLVAMWKEDEEKTRGLPLITNPGDVDEKLWKKAKDASKEAFGEIKYPFVSYLYKKWGGQFVKEKK